MFGRVRRLRQRVDDLRIERDAWAAEADALRRGIRRYEHFVPWETYDREVQRRKELEGKA